MRRWKYEVKSDNKLVLANSCEGHMLKALLVYYCYYCLASVNPHLVSRLSCVLCHFWSWKIKRFQPSCSVSPPPLKNSHWPFYRTVYFLATSHVCDLYGLKTLSADNTFCVFDECATCKMLLRSMLHWIYGAMRLPSARVVKVLLADHQTFNVWSSKCHQCSLVTFCWWIWGWGFWDFWTKMRPAKWR